MLLPVKIFRRRARLAILALVVLATCLAHYSSLPTAYLPPHEKTGQWSKAAQDQMKRRLHEASKVTSSWWHRGMGADELLGDVANATLGFQEIFVVNLPLRTDRSDAMALAASLTGLHVSFSAGVGSQVVEDRVLPADSANRHITPGNKGSWRAHMNVLRSIIDRNVTSALVMEDDIDWDVRLKSQMASFALASRAFSQPLKGTSYSSSHWHTPPFDEGVRKRVSSDRDLASQQPRKGQAKEANLPHPPDATTQKYDMPLDKVPAYDMPVSSPYGDEWDVLWLGHCGTDFPTAPPSVSKRPDDAGPSGSGAQSSPAQLPLLRVLLDNDPTVPSPRDLRPHPFALPDLFATQYPPHTRVVHAASGTLCTQAYAVSQRGARKLLYQFGLASFTTGYDLMLRDWCDGMYRQGKGAEPRRRRMSPEASLRTRRGSEQDGPEELVPQCITVQPPLFSHYLTSKEAGSDIQGTGGGYLHKTGSQYIRLSVQQNLRHLANGASLEALQDQWPGEVGKDSNI